MKLSKKYLIFSIIISVLALAINIYIIVHSCLDGATSSNASKGVVDVSEDIVNTIAPGTVTPANHDDFATFIRKAFGHFGLFLISGLLSSLTVYLWLNPVKWSKYWHLILISLGFGLFMGILTEVIQLNVDGRSGQFSDVLIDSSGYILGFGIIFLILLLVIRKQNKKHQTTNIQPSADAK